MIFIRLPHRSSPEPVGAGAALNQSKLINQSWAMHRLLGPARLGSNLLGRAVCLAGRRPEVAKSPAALLPRRPSRGLTMRAGDQGAEANKVASSNKDPHPSSGPDSTGAKWGRKLNGLACINRRGTFRPRRAEFGPVAVWTKLAEGYILKCAAQFAVRN